MKNLYKLFLILFLANATILHGYCVGTSDDFVNDYMNLQNNLGDNNDLRTNSVKKEVKEALETKKENKENKEKKSKKKEDKSKLETNVTNLDLKSDELQYYPERQEVEATGNAAIIIPNDGTTLRADKLVLNQETGILKGFGNVRLIKDSNVMEGDSITINLHEKNALMDNPTTENMFVTLKSENAQLIAGKDILLENGHAFSKEDRTLAFGTSAFNRYGTAQLAEAKKVFYLKEKYDEQYTIKAKEIIIDSRENNDKITVRNADIYLKNIKVASTGNLHLITNKEQQYVETNMPEIGFIRQLGTYIGPGFVTGAPFGGALKLSPFLNIFEGQVGVGGMARYRNDKNWTEFAISSVDESETILRGEHDFNENWSLQYGMNGYMNEGFLGNRVAGKLAEVVYNKSYKVDDLGLSFRHRISGGIAEDFRRDFSTGRVRWQGQVDKPIWYYGDDINNRYAVFELSSQIGATAYGTGDTFALLRLGPRLRTETDRWIQTLGYYYTATHGETPFYFDRYMYGTNNIYLSEGLKLNKYLSVMWSGSLALARDAWDGKLMQENRFFVMVGPEDVKFTLGYDTVRQRTLFNCFFILGTKNADLEFKKLYVKNPDRLGKTEQKDKKPEKAKLEAKAEIKPSLKDRLFKRKPIQVEPETEEKVLSDDSEFKPVMHTVPKHEIIVPKVKEKKSVPEEKSINERKWNSGPVQLHNEATTPMLTPMTTPLQMQGY